MRTHYCGEINAKAVGQVVEVAGWVHRRRDHGGVSFIDFRVREGLLSFLFWPHSPGFFSAAARNRCE